MTAAELNEQSPSAEQYAESILAGWERYIAQEERQSPSKRPYTYAGSYEPCDRKMVLLLTDGDKVTPFPTETLARFKRGKDRERNMIIDLTRVGEHAEPRFGVIGQQERFELLDHKGRVAIVGKVDLRLDYGKGRPNPPVEIKDWNVNLTERIQTFEDIFSNQWTRKGGYQLLTYLYAAGEKFGFLLLPRPGFPKLLPVELYPNLERVEEFLQKAERALDHKEAGTLPDYFQDASECKRCPFYGSVCNPPLASGEGAQIITDPEAEQKLLRLLELKESGEEYNDLDEWAKKRFRGVEMGVAGSIILQGKWQRNTTYPLNEEAKARIEQIKAPFKKVDEKGRFTLQIVKV